MNREEADKLEAGSELDVMVMVKVMGWRVWYYPTTKRFDLFPPELDCQVTEHDGLKRATLEDLLKAGIPKKWKRLPKVSTEISAAWLVWQHFGEDTAFAEALCKALHIRECTYSTSGTVCLVLRELSPLTICRAALLAVASKGAGGE